MLKTFSPIAAAGVAATLAAGTPARADDTHSARVTYADLNLASPAGEQKLQHRVSFAARSVCDTDDVSDPEMTSAIQHCRVAAVASAQPAIRQAVEHARQPSVTVLEATSLIVTAP